MLINSLDRQFIQLVNENYKEETMKASNTKCSLKSGSITFVKYICATAMLGIIILLVIATYVAAK